MKIINLENIRNKKCLRLTEVMEYISMGRNVSRKLMDEIGATRHVGGRVVFDREVIDKYFSQEVEK